MNIIRLIPILLCSCTSSVQEEPTVTAARMMAEINAQRSVRMMSSIKSMRADQASAQTRGAYRAVWNSTRLTNP